MRQDLKQMLIDLDGWRRVFPTKIEIATAKTQPATGRAGAGLGLGLPFKADQWLDDPQNGLDGARSWEGLEAELSAWCQTILDQKPKDPIKALLEQMDIVNQSAEKEALTDTVRLIWGYVAKVVGYADSSGPSCLKCGNAMSKKNTPKGWDGLYRCGGCGAVMAPETYIRLAKQQARTSQTPFPTSTVCWLFPTISSALLRTWKHRGKIAPAGQAKNGEALWIPAEVARLVKINS